MRNCFKITTLPAQFLVTDQKQHHLRSFSTDMNFKNRTIFGKVKPLHYLLVVVEHNHNFYNFHVTGQGLDEV